MNKTQSFAFSLNQSELKFRVPQTINPSPKPQQVALLVTPEYEGITRNGGIGTYYRTLSEKLTAAGFYTILLLAQTHQKFGGKSTGTAIEHTFSLGECSEFLDLSSQQESLLLQLQQTSQIEYQNYCTLFFVQAFTQLFSNAYIYIEFPEMLGLGYRTIQAKQAGILSKNCITAVTLHSSQEWMNEAHNQYVSTVPHWFWQTRHYEQYCFENADLAFFLSYFLKKKVEQYGWKTTHSLHLPFCFSVLESMSKIPTPQKELQQIVPPDRIPLVFFGRLEERKGFLTFIKALQLIAPNIAKKVQVIFLGKNVTLQGQGLKYIDSHRYIENTIGKNWKYSAIDNLFSRDAINFIRDLNSPIVCLTSHQENFPNTALEMGQLPIRLVVADTGGFQETLNLIKRQSGLYWFTPENANTLAKAITQAISKPPEVIDTPKPEFLHDVNKRLLNQRWEYMKQTFNSLEISPATQPNSSQAREWILGMTSMEEQLFLEDYARNHYSGQGEIVELGCWLGSSTISLAKGLEKSYKVSNKNKRIHAYDLFIWCESANMNQSVIGTSVEGKYREGESFLEEYLSRIKFWQHLIQVHPGDLTQIGWNQNQIEFLFIDAMKSFELANSIKQNFFPALIPNVSIIIHQDFAHFYTSWIHLMMYRLRDYLVPTEHPFMYSSRGFRCVKQIPDYLLITNWSIKDFSQDEVEAAFSYSLEITPKRMQANIMAAKVMYFIHTAQLERASLEFKKAVSQVGSNEWRELVDIQKCAKKYYALDLLA